MLHATQRQRRRTLTLITLALAALAVLAGCGGTPAPTTASDPEPTAQATTAPPTATSPPTETPAPTATLAPTDTPVPATPTAAPTEEPENAALEGAWLVTHEQGSLTCPEITVPIPANEPEEMNVELRDQGEIVYVENLSGDNLSAQRSGDHTFKTSITTQGETLHYTLTYAPGTQTIDGLITATITDPDLGTCDLERSFSAVPAS